MITEQFFGMSGVKFEFFEISKNQYMYFSGQFWKNGQNRRKNETEIDFCGPNSTRKRVQLNFDNRRKWVEIYIVENFIFEKAV